VPLDTPCGAFSLYHQRGDQNPEERAVSSNTWQSSPFMIFSTDFSAFVLEADALQHS